MPGEASRRNPDLASADAGFYSAKNEAEAKQMGVKRVSVPNRSTKSAELKRRHGLNRCRYQGETGMKPYVGLSIISDNLINLSRAMTNCTAQTRKSNCFLPRPCGSPHGL